MAISEQRIAAAAKLLGKATAKLARIDPELAKLYTDALAAATDTARQVDDDRITQQIPVETIAEIAEQWRAEIAKRESEAA